MGISSFLHNRSACKSNFMPALYILVASLAVHFWKFGYPASVVFDETHIGKFITGYWTGSYFFDVHPPLARLLTALFGYLSGANELTIDWSQIGNPLPWSALLMRLLPIILGTMLPVIIYFICRKFDLSQTVSVIAGLLICFENSLLAQSRFLMHDNELLFFGFLSILLYQIYTSSRDRRVLYLILSAISLSFTISTKWLGLSFLFIILFMHFWNAMKNDDPSSVYTIKNSLLFLFTNILAITIIYTSLFALHFRLLPKSGSGDDYMSKTFQTTLIGNKYSLSESVIAPNFLKNFFELNKQIYSSQHNLTATHAYTSKWYTWPMMDRSIYYWTNSSGQSKIFYLGNPLIYWLGSLSIIILLWRISVMLYKRFRHCKVSSSALSNSDREFFVVIAYLVNLLPFIMIGRVMFLYHYGSALVFSIIAIAIVLDSINNATRNKVALLLLMTVFVIFLYFSPLTYGDPLTPNEFNNRMWFSSWR